jgi:hypothetical protein
VQTLNYAAVIAGFVLMQVTTTAIGDALTIRICNDGAEEILATVYDMNAQPPGAALRNYRINGFAWIPVLVTADAAGKAHVRWSATTADRSFRRCGHHDNASLVDDASVRVHANSGCSLSAR